MEIYFILTKIFGLFWFLTLKADFHIFSKSCMLTKMTFADASNLSTSIPQQAKMVPIGTIYQIVEFPQNCD
jgi:hypothetical protein